MSLRLSWLLFSAEIMLCSSGLGDSESKDVDEGCAGVLALSVRAENAHLRCHDHFIGGSKYFAGTKWSARYVIDSGGNHLHV